MNRLGKNTDVKDVLLVKTQKKSGEYSIDSWRRSKQSETVGRNMDVKALPIRAQEELRDRVRNTRGEGTLVILWEKAQWNCANGTYT